jgi:hypothetical protein
MSSQTLCPHARQGALSYNRGVVPSFLEETVR